jgi:phosphatidylinositol-3-phosphatase
MNHRAQRWLRQIAVLAVATALGSCGTSDSRFPAQTRRSPRATVGKKAPRHIVVILMENEEYGDIIGSASTPYINGLANHYALATEMFAISHPSLPNYLALTSGSTHGIHSDCTSCTVPGAGLAGQLARKQISWKAYMEDLPRPCFKGASAGNYAKKHDPFVYYTAVAGNPALCNRVVPLSQLAKDERRRRLPRFIWITPNLCHDMHDCSTATGDRFLSHLVPPLLSALGPSGLLIVTWDEGLSGSGCCTFASGGHITTIVAGPNAKSGARMTTPADHYSVLQTIEDLLGLSRLGHADCTCTPTLQPLLAGR